MSNGTREHKVADESATQTVTMQEKVERYEPPSVIEEKEIPAVTRAFQNTSGFLPSSTVHAASRRSA